MSRIGLFGGAFDPPHLAHRALVQAAWQQLELGALHVLPTGQAWHKAPSLTPAAHRLAMAQINFADMPGVQVDDREIRRSGPTYTIDTVRELQAQYPQAELCVLMGLDQARALPSWRDWEALLAEAIICIADRQDGTRHTGAQADFFEQLAHLPRHRLRRVRMPPMSTSATQIRQLLATHQSIDGLVSPAVASYIAQHHLYTCPPDDH